MTKKVRFMDDRQLRDLGNELRKNVIAAENIGKSPKNKNLAKGTIEGVEQAIDSMFLAGVLGADDHDFLKLWVRGEYELAVEYL